MQLKVGIDIDGTLAELHKLLVQWFNETRGTLFYEEDIYDWDLLKTPFNLGLSEFRELTFFLWKERWRYISPSEFDIEKKLSMLNQLAEVHIVTGREENKGDVISWLSYHSIPYKQIVFVGYRFNKALLGYDIIVDDNPELAEQFTGTLKGNLLLYDRPWNKRIQEGPRVKRIKNFNQVVEFVRQYQ